MEKFCEYLKKKYFVDYEDTEIKDISEAMDIFFTRLRETFNGLSEVLQIERLVPCGSMEEKTTVLGEVNTALEYDPSKNIETIEFDCLAVLKHIVPDMEIKPSCPGYRRIASKTFSILAEEKARLEKSESYQNAHSDRFEQVQERLRFLLLSGDSTSPGACGNDSEMAKPTVTFETFVAEQITKKLGSESGENVDLFNNLHKLHKFVSGSCKCVSTEFMVIVDSAAEELCESSETRYKIDEDVDTFRIEMPTGILQYQRCLPGCQLALTWLSKIKPDAEKIILADFVPAFQVPKASSTEDADPPNYLVAKGCRTPDCEAGCWRLSHCLAEIKAIQTTSQCHRNVYKILKIFNQSKLSALSDNALKSYHIKTALLTHIKRCLNTDNSNITYCMSNTLETINSFIEKEKVPHWKDPNYSLVLKVDTCHRLVPLLLQFVFGTAVKSWPKRLYLTVRSMVGRGYDIKYHKAGSKLSNLVCQVVEDIKCYENLETEIENTLLQAADTAPTFCQKAISYSLIIEDQESPDDTITVYQRCFRL